MDPNIKPHPVISRTPPGHGEDQLAALFGLCGQRRRKSSTAFFLTCSLPGHPESGTASPQGHRLSRRGLASLRCCSLPARSAVCRLSVEVGTAP